MENCCKHIQIMKAVTTFSVQVLWY